MRSRDTRTLPIKKKKKKAVLSVACLYSIVTLQPKPISVWSGSSRSKLLIFPIHQSGTKPTYLHTLALLLSPASRPSPGRDSRLSDRWLVYLSVHMALSEKQEPTVAACNTYTRTRRGLGGLRLCAKRVCQITRLCTVYWYSTPCDKNEVVMVKL